MKYTLALECTLSVCTWICDCLNKRSLSSFSSFISPALQSMLTQPEKGTLKHKPKRPKTLSHLYKCTLGWGPNSTWQSIKSIRVQLETNHTQSSLYLQSVASLGQEWDKEGEYVVRQGSARTAEIVARKAKQELARIMCDQLDLDGSKWIQMGLSVLRGKQLHRCRSIIRFNTKALPAASWYIWYCMSSQYTYTNTHTQLLQLFAYRAFQSSWKHTGSEKSRFSI